MDNVEVICPKCKGLHTTWKIPGSGGCNKCYGEGVIMVFTIENELRAECSRLYTELEKKDRQLMEAEALMSEAIKSHDASPPGFVPVALMREFIIRNSE